ncbi:Hypothetical protein NTJ_00816 [Nesidiocoris tenuis]|uniref:Uncharacterized protein n=1 Tax=Nesidiocoris tenuis TaxID=355587 RepID=A0ABN7A9P0_9HEMI|nr:Hypothetical protein NTJ_00816 [Nesidiocoris tenuis]
MAPSSTEKCSSTVHFTRFHCRKIISDPILRPRECGLRRRSTKPKVSGLEPQGASTLPNRYNSRSTPSTPNRRSAIPFKKVPETESCSSKSGRRQQHLPVRFRALPPSTLVEIHRAIACTSDIYLPPTELNVSQVPRISDVQSRQAMRLQSS